MRQICDKCHEVVKVCDECKKPLKPGDKIRCDGDKWGHFCMECSAEKVTNADIIILD